MELFNKKGNVKYRLRASKRDERVKRQDWVNKAYEGVWNKKERGSRSDWNHLVCVRVCVVRVCAQIGQGAWSETVSEELYQTWSHNRDSMRISSCYYRTHSWCRLGCRAAQYEYHHLYMWCSHRNTQPVVTWFNTTTITLQSRRRMLGERVRFCCFHGVDSPSSMFTFCQQCLEDVQT